MGEPAAPVRRRLLLVHAHPDDETITNGATMARYAFEGARVTLVTCTRGEHGEVIPPELAHLAADADGTLGTHRVGELAAAMAVLGIKDHRFLGDLHAPGRTAEEVRNDGGTVYLDSGMAYDSEGAVVPAPDPPAGAFALADVDEAAELLAAQIRELRPQVVIGYEPGGGYGHPDHIQAHRVMMRAVDLAESAGPGAAAAGAGRSAEAQWSELVGSAEAAVPGWSVPKVYWAVMPESLTRAARAMMAVAGGADYRGPRPGARLPSMVVPDDQVTAAIDGLDFTPAKVAALRKHETQVSVTKDGAFYALSDGVRQPVIALEFYRLVRGKPAGERDDLGREIDLFAGTD